MLDILVQADLAPTPGHIIGPTWQRHRDGSWYEPPRDRTLGWTILNWLVTYVRMPTDDDPDAPFVPTDEQVRFLLWWYAVDDNGRFVYRSGVLRRCKGWGKDPLVAAMSLVELCGPVAFSHFHPVTGAAVGKRRAAPWIQVAAVSQSQTTNTFAFFPQMISDKLKTEFKLDVNKTIIYSDGGKGRIEGVTSSPHTLEGNRPTFVIMNEIQWWLENNAGHALEKVLKGNVTKIHGSRYLAICNAHVPGQDSIGERYWDNYQKVLAGKSIDTGLIYDALEAQADTPVSEIPSMSADPDGFREGLEALKEGLRVVRGDSVWLDLESHVAAILDVNNEVSESRRMYLNQVNAAEDAWITPVQWQNVFDEHLPPLRDGERITMGLDGSSSEDHTAITVCRVSDAALFTIRVWDPKNYGGKIPKDQVDAIVHWLFGKYDVVGFRADVKEFESYIATWTTKYRRQLKVKASPNNPIAFDMRGQTKKFAFDCEAFHTAVIERELKHGGDALLKLHVLAAHRHPTTYNAISIRKATKDSPRKIDAAVTAVLAFAARQEFLMTKGNPGEVFVG